MPGISLTEDFRPETTEDPAEKVSRL